MSDTTTVSNNPPSITTTGSGGHHNHNHTIESLLLQARIDDDTRQATEATWTAATNVLNNTNRTAEFGVNATDRNGLLNLQSIERNAGESRLEVQRVANELSNLTVVGTKDNLAATKESQYLTEVSFKQNIIEMLKRFAHTDEENQENFADVKIEAAKNFGAIQLEACKNTAALEAKIAECCCELRTLVSDKAAATDALIAKLDSDRVKEALAQANAKILALTIKTGVAV